MCIGQNCASEQQMQQLRNKWPQNVTNSVTMPVLPKQATNIGIVF